MTEQISNLYETIDVLKKYILSVQNKLSDYNVELDILLDNANQERQIEEKLKSLEESIIKMQSEIIDIRKSKIPKILIEKKTTS